MRKCTLWYLRRKEASSHYGKHPNAPQRGSHRDIAKTVLMPGDPLRAKYIADHYLEDVHLFNEVRNMLGYTGTYQGHPVSVMGGGMGMPSIGIYSYELYEFYGVESIIRVAPPAASTRPSTCATS